MRIIALLHDEKYFDFGRFIQVKGTKEEAIHLLSSNYDAVAQIANLLAEWLLMTDLTLAEVQSTVEDNLKNMIIKHFDQKKADSIFLDESKGVSSE